MAVVFIPSLMRGITQGRAKVEAPGRTVGEVIDALDRLYPGAGGRLVEGGRLSPGVSVAVDGEVSSLGLTQPVDEGSEIHFLPAMGGGSPTGGTTCHPHGLACC
jgi:molybdopterin synthase sulfur carrier subunit